MKPPNKGVQCIGVQEGIIRKLILQVYITDEVKTTHIGNASGLPCVTMQFISLSVL